MLLKKQKIPNIFYITLLKQNNTTQSGINKNNRKKMFVFATIKQ